MYRLLWGSEYSRPLKKCKEDYSGKHRANMKGQREVTCLLKSKLKNFILVLKCE